VTNYSSPTKIRLTHILRPGLKARIFHRDDFTCQYCGDEASEIDHIIPAAFGGDRHPTNLVAACRFCNATASDKVFNSFEEKQAYLLALTERRIKRKRRRLSICADCGAIYEYRQHGSSRVLCAECYEIDIEGATDTKREIQARLRELNAAMIRARSAEERKRSSSVDCSDRGRHSGISTSPTKIRLWNSS
jgi:hypothetical protein